MGKKKLNRSRNLKRKIRLRFSRAGKKYPVRCKLVRLNYEQEKKVFISC